VNRDGVPVTLDVRASSLSLKGTFSKCVTVCPHQLASGWLAGWLVCVCVQRPVFWKDADAAQKEVMEYLQQVGRWTGGGGDMKVDDPAQGQGMTRTCQHHRFHSVIESGQVVSGPQINGMPVLLHHPLAVALLPAPPALLQADLIKVSDADLEWLIGMPLATALINPCAVSVHKPAACKEPCNLETVPGECSLGGGGILHDGD
jgi:hypothetical protein